MRRVESRLLWREAEIKGRVIAPNSGVCGMLIVNTMHIDIFIGS